MSGSFTPYYVGSDAYIRVHVPNGPRPDGSIVVYLTNGTALLVNDEELLHLDAGRMLPARPTDRTLPSEHCPGHETVLPVDSSSAGADP
jgi:hypothetical protein